MILAIIPIRVVLGGSLEMPARENPRNVARPERAVLLGFSEWGEVPRDAREINTHHDH